MSADSLDVTLTTASWRRLRPERVESLRRDLRAHLLALTVLPGKEALLAKAAGDNSPASMAVAVAVREAIEEEDSDLEWSWVALAAVSRGQGYDTVREFAAAAIACRLLRLAMEAGLHGHPNKAARLRDLALRWADEIMDTFGSSRVVEDACRWSQHAHAAVTAFAEEAKPKPVPAGDADAARAKAGPSRRVREWKPSLVVVPQIGAGRGSAEDKSIVESWKSLTEPVPLAGGADPRVLGEALLAEFPWMGEAVDAVVGDLELRRAAGSAHAHFRPILLLGPPGCGKSRFARKLAELLGVGHGEVNAGGSSDNRLVAGTARGWSSASPAYVLHVMRDSACANPVLFIDEIDKASHGSHNGDVRATLLTMIGNAGWPDECLMAKTDLSQVNWVLAANDAQPLRGPLLTRLRVVAVPNPGPEHADAVIASISRDVTRELGLPPSSMPELSPHAEAALKDAFAKGHSVRRVRAAYEGALRAGGMMGSLRTVN